MKTKVILIVIAAGLLINAMMMRTPAGGQECTAGIKKEHLDPTPGAFVDNTTIEIDETNGLQVVDASITAEKMANMSPTSYAGEESVTLPNGLIMKFGYQENDDSTTGTVTFGVPFPTACVSVQITHGPNTSVPAYSPSVQTKSASNFTYYKQSQPDGIYWEAKGY